MNPLIVIQARLASTRLPRKILLPLGEKSVLQRVVERCQKNGAPVVVAMPDTDLTDIYSGLYPFSVDGVGDHGPDADVLGRYARTADTHDQATHLIRVTADCPFLDSALIVEVVDALALGHDYVGNTLERTYPRGLDVEGFSVELLREAHHSTTDPYDREHVTPWIQRHAVNPFHVKQAEDYSHYRWCLDTVGDYHWMQGVTDKYPDPTTAQLMAYRPERFDG